MNNRHIPEKVGGKNNDAQSGQTSDQRPLVLLLIGLLVIGVHIAGREGPKAVAVHTADSLVWLAGSTLQEGVYSVNPRLLPPMTSDLSGLYRSVGLTPSAALKFENGRLFSNRDHNLPLGLRLENDRLPTVIAPPALFHSFMFLPIPINEADGELLTTIPGIGPHLAEQILALRRKNKQINGPEDLLALPGIGRGRLQHLVKYLSFKQSGS